MELLKKLYCFILYINEHVLIRLNVDNRMNAFIGIVGLSVAIVVFVAETVNNTKIETKKRFVVSKTKMKRTLICSILVLTFCIVKNVFKYNNEDVLSNIIFFIFELFLNIFMGYSIYLTIRLFIISIKLNINNEYYDIEFDKYLYDRLDYINKKNIEFTEKKLINDSLDDYISDNSKYYSCEIDDLSDYISIKSDSTGIFKTYSIRTLDTIIDKIDKIDNSKKEFELKSECNPRIILNLEGGEKINRDITIAYINKNYNSLAESLKSAIIFNDNIPFQDNEIGSIVNDLYLLYAENGCDSMDRNRRIYKYYDYLYKNNMRYILSLSYDYLKAMFVNCYNSYEKNKQLVSLLKTLSYMAYSYKDFDHYKFLNDYLYYCFREQLSIHDDKREVAYDFIENVIRYDYYSIKENDDSVYYDVLLSSFLCFLFDLLIKKEFSAIEDMFQNIIFDYNNVLSDEPDEFDILKMQFSFGFIYGLLILNNKGLFKVDDKKSIINLIEHIKNYFVDIYDQAEVIYYFKKYFDKNSYIQKVYDGFNFRFNEKKYRNSFSGTHVDDIFIIKEFVYLFNIDFCNLDNINSELINKDNKFFYSRLSEAVSSCDNSKLDELLDIKFNYTSFISLIENLKNECEKKEKDYIKENELSKEKIKEFKEKIFSEIKNGNGLFDFLKSNNKYKLSDTVNKKMFGFNQVISRDIFFDDVYGIDNVGSSYGYSIISGITKDYIKNLDSISKVKNISFVEYIKTTKKTDNYIIITSPMNRIAFYDMDYKNDVLYINGREIPVIAIPKVKDIYLIKVENLPEIHLCKINTKNEKFESKDGIYFKLLDCSKNEFVRKDVLKNSDWLSEIGDKDEQIEYLKAKCIIKLFVSPIIKKVPYSSCIKFITEKK